MGRKNRKVAHSLNEKFGLPDEGEPMITFLPYSDFFTSLQALDNRRLGKQRLEAQQILDMLVGVGKNRSWGNHPAVGMWRGYESALGLYLSLAIREWMVRGFKNTMEPPYDFNREYTTKTLHYAQEQFDHINDIEFPEWLGNEDFHASHRSNLLRKEPEHYGQFGWIEATDLPYVWPKGKTRLDLEPDIKPITADMVFIEGKRKHAKARLSRLYDAIVDLITRSELIKDPRSNNSSECYAVDIVTVDQLKNIVMGLEDVPLTVEDVEEVMEGYEVEELEPPAASEIQGSLL
jgi:hypothetical protein